MGAPAVRAGDRVTGTCVGHQVPSPAGPPMPAPAPLPFSAPLTIGVATSVLVRGSPAVVEGSRGHNSPPHVGLHASDPKAAPTLQEATVTSGSGTVLLEGKGAAYTGCTVTACLAPQASVVGTAATVLVGR